MKSYPIFNVYEINKFTYLRDNDYLTNALYFLTFHSLSILITSHTRNASIIVFPLAWIARSERQTSRSGRPLIHLSAHRKTHSSSSTSRTTRCVSLGSDRRGGLRNEWRRNTKVTAVAPASRRAPTSGRESLLGVHVTRSHVWHCLVDEEGPLFPDRANRLA